MTGLCGGARALVGIGASAGGLGALSRLLENLPPDTGLAFVVLQHLDPQHPSLLSHLLSSKTSMPVIEVVDGVEVAGDRVYVAPPGGDPLVEEGRLRLMPREPTAHLHLPIDGFLRSLADDLGEQAVGVILSGAASDGAVGLAAIKSAGGVTFAQDPATAEYASMPASAIAARAVDFILPPEEIGGELARLAADPDFAVGGAPGPPGDEDEADKLGEVFALLHGAFQVDFSSYKLPTIRRRIARRMLVRRCADLGSYVDLLGRDRDEVGALYRDILIMVTEFFREPEVFTVLRERVFPAILDQGNGDAPVRVWVPGCASGEEAYSLAITLLEVTSERGQDVPVKIFATDISEPDLEIARRGAYAENISAGVAPHLLRRYFARVEGGYRIAKAVRELCVFARHDVTRDPPFPNLDLVSCRNLLIYLDTALQRWVIPSLHYGLRPDGYLVLGRSESVAGFTELFEAVDKKHRVFKKLVPAGAGQFRLPAVMPAQRARKVDRVALENTALPPKARSTAREEADKAVIASFASAGVTVDSQLGIVEFRGDTGPYVKHRPGRPSLNLLDLLRDDLAGKARAGLAEAGRTGSRAVLSNIHTGSGKDRRTVDLHVVPFVSKTGETHYVVLFDETAPTGGDPPGEAGATEVAGESTEVDRLRDELNETRERLEALLQEKEAANEELRAANEELLSSGEEMQSVNEELETTQEELQSTNQELRSRNAELGQVSDDLNNLLTSVSFPIIMVGRDLRIRRFTPAAARLLKVIASDVGRLITDLRLRVDVPDLERILSETIETMVLMERDVQDDEGRWYAMQVRPYKTLDNRIDGAVITLFDIDELKRLLAAEKSLATTLQLHYIHPLPEIPGLELAAAAETAQNRDLIGGDFHDVFRLPDGKVLGLIGDVSGKGVEAAGLAETTRIATRTAALVSASPDRILQLAHQLLGQDPKEHVTALAVVLDPATGEAVVASAGHPPPLHVSREGCVFLEPQYGTPLGALRDDFPPKRFTLARGDVLVLYTDGVVEARRGKEPFGEERLIEASCAGGQRSAQALVQSLSAAVKDFADELKDDLQIVALRRT